MSGRHYEPTSWPSPWRQRERKPSQQYRPTPLPLLADLRTAVAEATEAGERVPCLGRDEWLSEDRHTRVLAARLCAWCPVQTECYVAATDHGEQFGVWGGYDLTRRTHRTKNDPAPAGTDPHEGERA